jgi:ubiquinone/menaquinone biosynthesis C-methylase UbiE
MLSKAYRGLAMEGPIATWYTLNTGRERSRFVETARLVEQRVPSGSRVLEVAPGPGYLSVELARRGYAVTAVDISESFVRIATEHARESGVEVDVRQGNASRLPLPDAMFEYVVCTAAFKNFTDPVGALDEMHRVLRPGGQASITDLRKDATAQEIESEVAKMHLSPVNRYLTCWTFRMLLKRAYTREALERMVAQSRFGRSEITMQGIGFELRLTKPR